MEEKEVMEKEEVSETPEHPAEEKPEGECVPDEEKENTEDTAPEIPEKTAGEYFEEVNEKLDHLAQLFTQKIQHTAHEEKIVDQMHAELQKYKQDMYSQLVRPILLDIIEIRDSILRVSAVYSEKPEGEQDIPLKTFRGYTYDIEDILGKNNITIYTSEEGEPFNPAKQRALKKIKTPVEELHGRIAESLSSGYDYLGKPILPEKVSVYAYEKPSETEGDKK